MLRLILVCGLSLVSFLTMAYSDDLGQAKKIKITSSSVEYGDQKQFEGYLVVEDAIKEPTPAILIIHNWMGVTNETRKQANRFAGLGYIAFAADIYGKDMRPKDAKEAGKIATEFKTNRKLFRERLNLALEELKKIKNVDTSRIVVAGYCFGGTGAIELARSGADILGAISFHGGLDSPTPEDGKKIKGKILALCGAVDPYIPEKDIVAFEAELNAAKVDYQIVRYSNTVHSFTEESAGTDNSKGSAYNHISDTRSFVATQIFLMELFQKK